MRGRGAVPAQRLILTLVLWDQFRTPRLPDRSVSISGAQSYDKPTMGRTVRLLMSNARDMGCVSETQARLHPPPAVRPSQNAQSPSLPIAIGHLSQCHQVRFSDSSPFRFYARDDYPMVSRSLLSAKLSILCTGLGPHRTDGQNQLVSLKGTAGANTPGHDRSR